MALSSVRHEILTRSIERHAGLLAARLNPPYRNQWGFPDLNTFLVYVPAIVVPAGFTSDNLPSSITFMEGLTTDS